MSAEDWIPDWYPDYDADGWDDGSVLCRYCNMECYWGETPNGWRLFELHSDDMHICPVRLKRDADEELVSADE